MTLTQNSDAKYPPNPLHPFQSALLQLQLQLRLELAMPMNTRQPSHNKRTIRHFSAARATH